MTPNLSLEEVRARRKQIQAEDRVLAEIESELHRLAERWRSVLGGTEHKTREAPIVTPVTSAIPVPTKAKTKNALISEALNPPRALWQTAKEIKAYLESVGDREYPMSSISPALTDLKNSGTIVRKDMLVALGLRVEKEEPDFLKTNEAPPVGPEGASQYYTGQGGDPGTGDKG